jgi:FAD:protein FMN transferase
VTRDIDDRTVVVMDTFVTIKVIGHGESAQDINNRTEAIERAFGWFREIETRCTRFDPASELMQLNARGGVAVRASPILFEAVQFALAVAEETGGAFDPTVGYQMESRGFNRNYRTGEILRTTIDIDIDAGPTSYRDVRLDPGQRTITLLRPLILDLGAVVKGLAIDTAARELEPFENFAIDAGGDLYLGGHSPAAPRWSVGIRHPRRDGELLDTIRVTNRAVCTSGDYERTRPVGGSGEVGHHILDPRDGNLANTVASVTVVAASAMLADAVATAAFVLGPAEGLQLFDRLGVDGLIVSPALERYATRGMSRDYALGTETSEAGHAARAIRSHAQGSVADHPGAPDRSRVVRRRHRPGRAKRR